MRPRLQLATSYLSQRRSSSSRCASSKARGRSQRICLVCDWAAECPSRPAPANPPRSGLAAHSKIAGRLGTRCMPNLKKKSSNVHSFYPKSAFFFHLVSALHAFVLWAFGNVRWSLTSLYIIKKLMPVDNFLWQ
jgi:hypothetical protein